MNQFKEFQKQCADAGDLLRSPMKGTLSHGAIAFNEGFDTAIKRFQSAIRNLPLPEASKDNVVYQHMDKITGRWITIAEDIYLSIQHPSLISRTLYALPPDAELVRKENEHLRELLESAANGLRWYHDHYPESVSEADYEIMEKIDQGLKGGAE